MTNKEQIMIDGVDVNRCIDFNKRDKVSCYHILYDKCNENPNCYFKQLARKTQLSIEQSKELIRLRKKLQESTIKNRNLKQECEQIKEKYEALRLENEEGYEIVAELKHECEELKKELNGSEKWRIKAESLNEKLELKNTCYRKALEEIEEYINQYEMLGKLNIKYILNIINKAKGGGECQ